MLKHKQIVQKIKTTFETDFFTMSSYFQEHYVLRMYRLTGFKKYLSLIIKSFEKDLSVFIQEIQNFSDQNYQKARGIKLLKNFKTYNLQRKKSQKDFYLKNPEVKFLINFVCQFNKLNDFGLTRGRFVNYFKKAQSSLKKINHEKISLNHKYFQVDPSEVINTIYFLKNLKIVNLTPKIKPLLEETLLSQKSLKLHKYEILIYALTHIVINASNFYQNFVSEKKHSWVLNWLEKNLEEIIEKTTPDIVAEVGLCFKLSRSHKKDLIKKTQDFIIKSFDEKLGYIPREERKTLEDSQHRNILAIMLLTDFRRLHKGPNLRRYFLI